MIKVKSPETVQRNKDNTINPDINPGIAYLMEYKGKEEAFEDKNLIVALRVAFLWGMHEGIKRGKRTKTNKFNSKTKSLINGIYNEIDTHFGELRRETDSDQTNDGQA